MLRTSITNMEEEPPEKFRSLEASILKFLNTNDPAKKRQLHDLLTQVGLFDLISNGITRILVEKIPPKQQLQFLKDYICIKNWDSEETEQLEEEWNDLNNEVQALKTENEQLKTEWEDILHPPPPKEPVNPPTVTFNSNTLGAHKNEKGHPSNVKIAEKKSEKKEPKKKK